MNISDRKSKCYKACSSYSVVRGTIKLSVSPSHPWCTHTVNIAESHVSVELSQFHIICRKCKLFKKSHSVDIAKSFLVKLQTRNIIGNRVF